MHTTVFDCINKNGMSTIQEIMCLAGFDDLKTIKSLLSDMVDQKMIQRKFDSGQVVYVANKKSRNKVMPVQIISDEYVFAHGAFFTAHPN